MAIAVSERNGHLIFAVKVVPRAAKTELAGETEGMLRVRIAAPPVDGAANEELIRFLAKRLGVPRSDISIVAGLSSRKKRVQLANLTEAQLLAALR
jgi:uncharacterized protein (TIGR00251 family)